MSARGFSVVEALVATLILTVIIASAFQVLDPMHGAAQAQPETADQQQRLRVAVDAIGASLRAAGAGALVGGVRGALNRSIPAVLPYRVGESHPDAPAGIRFRSDVISLIWAPRSGAQTTLREAAAAGAGYVVVNQLPSCPPSTATTVCGFGPGTRAVLFDGSGSADFVTVTAAYGTTVEISRVGGLSVAYRAGAVLSEVVIRVFSFKVDSTGVPQLAQYDGFQSELPLVDNIVSLNFEYFGEPAPPRRLTVPLDAPHGPWTTYGPRPPAVDVDDIRDAWPVGENCTFSLAEGDHVPRLAPLAAGNDLVRLYESTLTDGPWCPDPLHPDAYDADLLRIRRVRFKLRAQVASAALRGPVGSLFQRGGRPVSGASFVPDQEITFDVAPPNLAAGR